MGLIRPPGLSDDATEEESDNVGSEGVEHNGSDSDYTESEDGMGITDGRTIRRPSSRSVNSSTLSQFLNQVREEMNNVEVDNYEDAQVMEGGASPQLVAPVLHTNAESDHSNTSNSQQSCLLAPARPCLSD